MNHRNLDRFDDRPEGLVHLKTLGHPALRRADGVLVGELRRKDLALLVYLCVEAVPLHARGRLAALLWGESREERARHSLTQALGRVVRALPPGMVAPDKESVRWAGGLECDAVTLLRGAVEAGEVDAGLPLYAGPFLEGFDPGAGAADFGHWSDRRREELRRAALRLLEGAGAEAETAGDWARALHLAERAVEIDAVWEQGHRRMLRALAARGERNGALRHYQAFEAWLAQEVGARPDPDTRALASLLRAAEAAPPAPVPAPPDRPEPPVVSIPPDPPIPPMTSMAPDPPPAAPVAAPPPAASAETVEAPPSSTPGGAADASPAGPAPAPVEPPACVPRRVRRMLLATLLLLLATAMLAAVAAVWSHAPPTGEPPEPPPGHGEIVRLQGTGRVYLAFGETLYEYPDTVTLCVCTGWHPEIVREVRTLPVWPRRMLPSVSRHGWLGSQLPVVSDHPMDKTAYVAVGCIFPGVPDPPTLDSIFGSGALGRLLEVPDSVLRRLPRAFVARGHPLRPAATLIRGPDERIRWITYHGGALDVDDPAVLASYCRSADEAVSVSADEFRYYRPWATLRPHAGDHAREQAFARRRPP
jgi:DNA-binding SARP family transcriptional activator